MAIRHRVGQKAFGDEPCRVRYVGEKECPYAVGYFAEAFEVHVAGIGRCSGNYHLRFFAACYLFYLVVIETTCLALHSVKSGFIQISRKVNRRPVRQMASVREVEAEYFIARLEKSGIDGRIGL